jgi:hypothetical protein
MIPSDGSEEHQNRNILVPDYLVPTRPVNPAALPTGDAIIPLARVPERPVGVNTVYAMKRDITSMLDLEPSSALKISTDTKGTRTISPLFVPFTPATVVDMATLTKAAPSSSGIADCCGGQAHLHACEDYDAILGGQRSWYVGCHASSACMKLIVVHMTYTMEDHTYAKGTIATTPWIVS